MLNGPRASPDSGDVIVCGCVCRYTREAGVRSLERKIGAICRAVAVKVAEGHKVSKEESPTDPGKKLSQMIV